MICEGVILARRHVSLPTFHGLSIRQAGQAVPKAPEAPPDRTAPRGWIWEARIPRMQNASYWKQEATGNKGITTSNKKLPISSKGHRY